MSNSTKDQPIYWATTVYKLWVREQLKARGWSLAKLAEEMEAADRTITATSGGISQFLGPEGTTPIASNTAWVPAINKVFGRPPPSHYDPTDAVTVIHDLIAERWDKMTEAERRVLQVLLGVPESLL
jgi:hypothetical protein